MIDAADLTALLVDVYARFRRGDLTAAAARREAAGFSAALRETAAAADDIPTNAGTTKIEMVYIPADFAEADLERLTPDFKPWTERGAVNGARLTPEDVDLLEVNALARARRGEIPEQTAKAEAFILKAIRSGLTLAPVAGGRTWGDMKRNHVDEPGTITIFSGVPAAPDPITGPVITFVHGFPVRGQEEFQEDAPPWPIMYMGKVTGYYVPKGWTKPEGEAFAAMMERIPGCLP